MGVHSESIHVNFCIAISYDSVLCIMMKQVPFCQIYMKGSTQTRSLLYFVCVNSFVVEICSKLHFAFQPNLGSHVRAR